MQHTQDWEPVVLRKKAPTTKDLKDESAVNAARRSGAQIETVKKFTAGTNKTSGTGLNAAKLDRETEELKHQTVSANLKTQIVQARIAKGLTQAQLAQAINEKPSVINEYESGRAIPNPQILQKLSRVLGVTLKKA